MNRKQFKEFYMKAAAAGIAGSILLFLMMIFILIKPQNERLREIKNEVRELNLNLKEYKNFGSSIKEYENKGVEIKEILENFKNTISFQENSDQIFFEELAKIKQEAGINIDKISPVGESAGSNKGYDKKIWAIRFNSDYKKLLEFIIFLESSKIFLGIEKLQLTSARKDPNHSVELSIYSAFPKKAELQRQTRGRRQKAAKRGSAGYSTKKSTSIFEGPIETANLLEQFKNFNKLTEVTAISTMRDPMYFNDTLFPPEKKASAGKGNAAVKKEDPVPVFILGGIIWDEKQPMVIIDGKLLNKGDIISEAKVSAITPDSAILIWRGRSINLKLNKGG